MGVWREKDLEAFLCIKNLLKKTKQKKKQNQQKKVTEHSSIQCVKWDGSTVDGSRFFVDRKDSFDRWWIQKGKKEFKKKRKEKRTKLETHCAAKKFCIDEILKNKTNNKLNRVF